DPEPDGRADPSPGGDVPRGTLGAAVPDAAGGDVRGADRAVARDRRAAEVGGDRARRWERRWSGVERRARESHACSEQQACHPEGLIDGTEADGQVGTAVADA